MSGFPKILGSSANVISLEWLDEGNKGLGATMLMGGGAGNGPTACHSSYSREIEIEFRCTENAGLGSPVYTGETTGCRYQFSWQTEYACLHEGGGSPVDTSHAVDCSVINGDGDVIDLTPLVRQLGHQSDHLSRSCCFPPHTRRAPYAYVVSVLIGRRFALGIRCNVRFTSSGQGQRRLADRP